MKEHWSPGQALRWALEVLDLWMAGKGLPMEPRTDRSTTGYQAHVEALSIVKVAGKHDIVDRHGDSWFYAWYVRQLPECAWRDGDLFRLRDARANFEDEMYQVGLCKKFLDTSGETGVKATS